MKMAGKAGAFMPRKQGDLLVRSDVDHCNNDVCKYSSVKSTPPGFDRFHTKL